MGHRGACDIKFFIFRVRSHLLIFRNPLMPIILGNAHSIGKRLPSSLCQHIAGEHSHDFIDASCGLWLAPLTHFGKAKTKKFVNNALNPAGRANDQDADNLPPRLGIRFEGDSQTRARQNGGEKGLRHGSYSQFRTSEDGQVERQSAATLTDI